MESKSIKELMELLEAVKILVVVGVKLGFNFSIQLLISELVALGMQFPDDPAEALRQANERILADTRANQFVTVFYGVVDLASGEMLYANAGHNPVYLFRKSNPERYETFIRTGPPMGIFGDLVWEEGSAKVNPGDLLLLYTDGVNEAQNTAEEFYDYDRLLREVNSHLALSAKAVHDAIINSVQTFVGQAPQFDDITLMILKRD